MNSTPFEIVYDRKPLTLLNYIPKSAKVQTVEEDLFARDIVLKLLKDNINLAKEKMKYFADKNRTFREFNIEDWVYLHLQPYRQFTATNHRTHKLSPKLGHFKLLRS